MATIEQFSYESQITDDAEPGPRPSRFSTASIEADCESLPESPLDNPLLKDQEIEQLIYKGNGYLKHAIEQAQGKRLTYKGALASAAWYQHNLDYWSEIARREEALTGDLKHYIGEVVGIQMPPDLDFDNEASLAFYAEQMQRLKLAERTPQQPVEFTADHVIDRSNILRPKALYFFSCRKNNTLLVERKYAELYVERRGDGSCGGFSLYDMRGNTQGLLMALDDSQHARITCLLNKPLQPEALSYQLRNFFLESELFEI